MHDYIVYSPLVYYNNCVTLSCWLISGLLLDQWTSAQLLSLVALLMMTLYWTLQSMKFSTLWWILHHMHMHALHLPGYYICRPFQQVCIHFGGTKRVSLVQVEIPMEVQFLKMVSLLPMTIPFVKWRTLTGWHRMDLFLTLWLYWSLLVLW